MSHLETLIPREKIETRVAELGATIRRDYGDTELIVVGVLKGSFMFMADLLRHLPGPVVCDFMRVASYQKETVSTGVVRFSFDLEESITGRDVLLVEDIVDTGQTMEYLMRTLRSRNPASLKLCALLHKPDRAKVQIPIDYLGFTIPNKFVVGYGLDCAGRYRNLPHLAVLHEDGAPGAH